MTVIADDVDVHDIGGIMGGMASGCSETTTDVLIECAYFDPDSIARTGQKLLLTSDARSRFERGVDPAFLDDGLAIATHLVLALCGGTASDITRAGAAATCQSKTVAYRPARVAGLAGIDVAEDEQAAILTRLGFGVTQGSPWQVTVPSWRRDIGSVAAVTSSWDGEADLVEEVVRIHGLDRVPATPLPRAEGVAKPTASPAQKLERKLRRSIAARGFDEAVTWSFLPPAEAEAFGGARLDARQPDFGRYGGDAAIAAARLAGGGKAQCRSRPAFGATVRTRPALSRRWRTPDRRVVDGRRSPGARLAQRRRAGVRCL